MLVSVDEMRALEREALRAGTSEADLMAAAGRAIADALAAWLPRTAGRRALVLVGKGNNGGDALIAARRLQEVYGVRATLYLTSERADDPLLGWPSEKTIVHGPRTDAALRAQLTGADVVIDGLHGIGARLPLEGAIASVLDIAGRHRPSTQRRV